ncbi:hypothetical protein RJZ56_003107 [Blastomyces dermatitidis]
MHPGFAPPLAATRPNLESTHRRFLGYHLTPAAGSTASPSARATPRESLTHSLAQFAQLERAVSGAQLFNHDGRRDSPGFPIL